jgi:hypothetical protein
MFRQESSSGIGIRFQNTARVKATLLPGGR